jgi:myosin heavy chain 6/7
VSDLERNKKELEQTIQRKDKEISSLAAKLEDEQSLVAKLQKQIKELQVPALLNPLILLNLYSLTLY